MTTFEEYLERLARCRTIDDVRDLYVAEMAAEGFDNVVFGGFVEPGRLDLRWSVVPEGYGEAYFAMQLYRTDPILARTPHIRGSLRWSDALAARGIDDAARRTMALCAELGLREGLTIPIYGPGRTCDVFSLGQRRMIPLDRGRTRLIQAKTYQAWLRYWDLAGAIAGLAGQEAQNSLVTGAIFDISTGGARDDAPCGGSFMISRALCRTLALLDIAARRHAAGLVALSSRISQGHAAVEVRRLTELGLVTDTPDDQRWIYFWAPTMLGRAHVNSCAHAASLRRALMNEHVARGEVPQP